MRITVFKSLKPTEADIQKYGVMAYRTNPLDVVSSTIYRFRVKNPDMRFVHSHRVSAFVWKLVFEKLEET